MWWRSQQALTRIRSAGFVREGLPKVHGSTWITFPACSICRLEWSTGVIRMGPPSAGMLSVTAPSARAARHDQAADDRARAHPLHVPLTRLTARRHDRTIQIGRRAVPCDLQVSVKARQGPISNRTVSGCSCGRLPNATNPFAISVTLSPNTVIAVEARTFLDKELHERVVASIRRGMNRRVAEDIARVELGAELEAVLHRGQPRTGHRAMLVPRPSQPAAAISGVTPSEDGI